MFRKLLLHAPQFGLYFVSGCTAVVADYGSYLILLKFGVWYIAASVVGGILGFATAFFCHKYFVFRNRTNFWKQLSRFFWVDMGNIAATSAILFALVEYAGTGEELGKVIAMGMVVFWNFFIYKFFVYA